MPRLVVTTRDGAIREIDAGTNLTLMEVRRDEGLDIEALCGGCCSCATCHVYIQPAFTNVLPAMGEDEDLLLAASGYRNPTVSRLSCQIRVSEQMEGLELTMTPGE